MDKRILSLFDYTGIMSQPYRDNGYAVTQVDIQLGTDVWEASLDELPYVHGIIAQPPCTDFANSGARWFAQKDADGRTRQSVNLVNRVLQLVLIHQPVWWMLENPVGRINTLVPVLGKAQFAFDPCDYGLPYRKRTQIWGDFTTPEYGERVMPEGSRKGQPNAWYSRVGGNSISTKNYRSQAVPGFARAFFNANP